MSHELHDISNHKQLDCLFNSLLRRAYNRKNRSVLHYWLFVRGICWSLVDYHTLIISNREAFACHWYHHILYLMPRANSRFAPSQWETALLCNNVSHWLGASLKSALDAMCYHYSSLNEYDLYVYRHSWLCLVRAPVWLVPIVPNQLWNTN